jgi:hypothetical protein
VNLGRTYSASAMERMMKRPRKITWWAAAEIIGVSDLTIRRMREKLERDGYSGLVDRQKGRVSNHRVSLNTAEEVLRLYREQYSDFDGRHFHAKLTRLYVIGKLHRFRLRKAISDSANVRHRRRIRFRDDSFLGAYAAFGIRAPEIKRGIGLDYPSRPGRPRTA